jgi:hypothetical protein
MQAIIKLHVQAQAFMSLTYSVLRYVNLVCEAGVDDGKVCCT